MSECGPRSLQRESSMPTPTISTGGGGGSTMHATSAQAQLTACAEQKQRTWDDDLLLGEFLGADVTQLQSEPRP
eukprot:1452811-Rhodomonas_salina.3